MKADAGRHLSQLIGIRSSPGISATTFTGGGRWPVPEDVLSRGLPGMRRVRPDHGDGRRQ